MSKPKPAPAALKWFKVYRQLSPKNEHGEWFANLQLAGSVEAVNGPAAIDKARELGLSAPVICAA